MNHEDLSMLEKHHDVLVQKLIADYKALSVHNLHKRIAGAFHRSNTTDPDTVNYENGWNDALAYAQKIVLQHTTKETNHER